MCQYVFMATLIVKWLISALAIFAVGSFLPGLHVADYITALWAALALGILNAIVRPILLLLTLPINLITLGLFTFVLNGFMFWLAAKFVSGFLVDGFWWAVLGALLVSAISTFSNRLLLGADGKWGVAKNWE
jgi:putative membrane protein